MLFFFWRLLGGGPNSTLICNAWGVMNFVLLPSGVVNSRFISLNFCWAVSEAG